MAKITPIPTSTAPSTTVESSTQPIEQPIVETPIVNEAPATSEVQNTIVNDAPQVQAEATVESKSEEPTNVTKITFDAPQSESNIETKTEIEAPKASIQDVLKTIPKDELYKFLDLDEHTIRFDEFRKKGGNPYDYIQQKAIDWDKVPNENLIKLDMQKQYPNLSQEKIERLFASKYKQGENDLDEDKEFGSIMMEADGDMIRRRNKEDQKKNDITTFQPPQQSNEYEAKFKQQEQEYQNVYNEIVNSEPVKKFISEKKLSIDIGNNKFHTFEIENPQFLIDVLFGKSAQGKPDPQLLLQAALFRAAPRQFIDGLVSQGRSIALLDELLKDGQNISKPQGSTPRQSVTTANKKITPSSNRISQYGG